jgi:hypothetical protein
MNGGLMRQLPGTVPIDHAGLEGKNGVLWEGWFILSYSLLQSFFGGLVVSNSCWHREQR